MKNIEPPEIRAVARPGTVPFAVPTPSRRLAQLRALVNEEASPERDQSDVRELLAQDPDAPDASCPRYAGIVTESGDNFIITADTLDELREDMAGRAGGDIPELPVAVVDLDTGERRDALIHTTVWFAGEANPFREEDSED